MQVVSSSQFVQETWRLGSVVPAGPPRYCSTDTWVGKHLVRAGSVVMPNWRSSMMSPSEWEDPKAFRPERHLSKKGSMEGLFAFGTGRRSCLGESLAKVENFLLLANLLHSFSLSKKSDDGIPGENDVVDGLTVGPNEFQFRVERRN